jgi:hypothetical protein
MPIYRELPNTSYQEVESIDNSMPYNSLVYSGLIMMERLLSNSERAKKPSGELTFTDAEHLSAADRARTLSGWAPILEGN